MKRDAFIISTLLLTAVIGTVTGILNQSSFDMIMVAYDNGNTMRTDEIHIGTKYESVAE